MLKSEIKDKPSTIGILGGGQLAKMLASDAYRMGINVAIIEGHAGSPAGDMTKDDFPNGWEDRTELDKFIEVSDRVTLENEFINPDILEYIESKGKKVYPSAKTMRLVQDKYIQKQTFENAGLPVPAFDKLDTPEEAEAFAEKHGYPFILKSRKFGYDGYGNAKIDNADDIKEAYAKFGKDTKRSSLMGEEFVPFSKELAVMVVRSETGEIAAYPCVETIQKNHICHSVIAPAEIDKAIQNKAKEIAIEAVKSIDGTGVFGIELFLTSCDALLINEIAPRPHNSGHYTIEACYTSQFENALRAVYGLPVGSTDMVLPGATMINLLGTRDGSGVPTDVTKMLKHTDVALHLYNKKQCRNGRKMGHLTALGNTPREAFDKAQAAADDFAW
jgi:5-(carboxyamino)imidazole ribonucleotide synthase